MENNNPSSREEKNKDDKLTPHELFEKHSQDTNHVVTEEELKNLKVGSEAEDENEVSKETDKKDDEIESLPGNDSLPNSFNILNS